ncbi:MAG: heme ABC transporter ATP-binding protein CcmA [endosymbiont of Galathealinum brachiosum]|uniref:Heme ABC transporter ATP-binding protein CcmA n=1 Tax=endosymbiont of Galathealinum brachiosum TaxID=2200906 RepID=A0A370D883_9GAMM|nr:MAG: heme ABC transporter ATP-binding protein CcmA [endosymbiont of Galathealinum brachiosum]
MTDATAGLYLKSVSCTRGYRDLFTGLDFELCPGQMLRVEGKNGSGKTSLLRIMAGLAQPLEGEVLWQGRKIHHAESDYFENLLFLGHRAAIKFELTPIENLCMAKSLHGSKTENGIEEALYQVGLYGFEDIPCAQLSAGQKRRVALAQLFLTRAKCWILDEPYTSLDVNAVGMLEALFTQHINNGGMLVITSHQPVTIAAGEQRKLVLPNTQLEPLV